MKTKEIRHNVFWQCVVISLTALIAYANTVFGTFVFDDTEAVVKNRDVFPSTSISNVFLNDFWGTEIASNVSHKSYRPLVILTYRLNLIFSNSELNAVHFHLTNICLYIILCLTAQPVYRLFFKNKNTNKDVVYLSCLLFAVHPVHTEAVSSIVGRADILASLLFLVSFLLYSKAVERKSHFYLLLVVIVILAATLCKETAITALAVCWMYDLLYSKIWKNFSLNTIKRSPFMYRTLVLVIWGLLVMYLRLKVMDFQGPTFTAADNPAAFSDSIYAKVFTYNYIYFLNFLLLIWPQWLCFDWSMGCIPLIKDTCDFRIGFVILFWCFLVFSCFKLVKGIAKYKTEYSYPLIMAISFILFPFLPASNLFLKVGFVIAERILLIPSLGFSFLVALGFKKLTTNFHLHKNAGNATFYLALCAIFFVRTIQRNFDWLSEESLFHSALEVCPLNAKVHYNIGKVAADHNRKMLAINEYRKAIELNPLYEQAMNNLANLLREEKQFEMAEMLLRKAVDIRPNFAAAWMNLGIVLTNLNRSEEAEHYYLTAISFRKRYPDCYYNLGNLYLDLKRSEEALKAWEKTVSFRPTHTAAWSNMLVLLDSLKRYNEVLELGKTALMHNPTSAALHFCIANTLGKIHQFEKAEKHFLEALNLNPNNALYFSNLGVLYHRWQQPKRAIEMYRKALHIDPGMRTAESNLRKLINMQH